MNISPYAGKLLPKEMLVDVTQLQAAYYDKKPDASVAEQRVSFGTSGHRGSALKTSFNENHVLAITQAICDYRTLAGVGVNSPPAASIISTPFAAKTSTALICAGSESACVSMPTNSGPLIPASVR